ncbi:MAG: maleylacetoacetate isomerase [Bdellovibrionales bacterium]|nr:maleylacetoacetate isomerase [Bdellovibrionales bacterium]
MKLYSYFRSSCSYRVRIALNLKGLDYEILPVHLVKDGGEQFKPEFQEINPQSRVPVLLDDSFELFQSMAIIEYLDEKHQRPSLFPGTAQERAHIRKLCEIINADVQPLQNLRVLTHLVDELGASEEQKLQWIRTWIGQGFASYEAVLQETAGKFSFGDQPTAADCFLIPQIYNALRFDMDLDIYPLISKVYNHCKSIEAFEKAHPGNQPDTPA